MARSVVSGNNVVPISGKGRARTVSGVASTSSRTFTDNSNSSSSGGGDSSWKDSVETRLGTLHSDVRNLLIGGLGLAAVLIGSGWLAYRDATAQISQIAIKQESLSGKIDTLNATMTGKLDLLGERLNDGARRQEHVKDSPVRR